MSAPVFGAWLGLEHKRLLHPQWVRVAGAKLEADPCSGREVNAWVNHAIQYQRDAVDYWQAPKSTLKLKTGDCEDMAILKRAILIARGLAPEKIFLVIGLDFAVRESHAVLLADGRVYDNLVDRVLEPRELEGSFRPSIAYGASTWLFGRKA